MANLSNINGKFVVEQTTGYVGVGTTDPNYPIEVLNASAEIALNASGGSIYRLRSDSTDAFRINKNGVGDRLVISSGGDATFSGSITVGAGNSSIAGDLYFGVNADIFKSSGTLMITASDSTFAGELNVKNASSRFISLNYEDSINSIISHNGSSYGLENLNVRGDNIYFYTDYEASSPKGNITLTLQNNHNAKFEGNVGIGLGPSTYSLHIYKSNPIALIQAANTSGAAQVQFFPRDASNVAHLQSIKGVDSNLTFLTGGNSGNSYVPTEKMRIDSNGNVSIKEGKLSIGQSSENNIAYTTGETWIGSNGLRYNSGSDTFARSSATSQAAMMVLTTTADVEFYAQPSTSQTGTYALSPKMVIKGATGNVGIGVSPSAKLQVSGTTKLGGACHFSSDASFVTSYNYTFRDGVYINNPNSSSAVGTANSVMSIGGSSGNSVVTSLVTTGAIGVGNSNPAYKLDVSGNIRSSTVTVYDGMGGTETGIGASSAGGNLRLYSAGVNRVTVENTSRTLSLFGLDTIGSNIIQFYNSAGTIQGYIGMGAGAANDFIISCESASVPMRFFNGGSERMRIKSNGFVGIGETDPHTKLDVKGATGTRNRNTQGSSVYETSVVFNAAGNATTNISIDTTTAFPPMGSGGFILVEVSASGYGNSGSNGLIFSYITGGYGGHYAAVNQPYHPVQITVNSMQAGTCTWYNPSATVIGITVATTNSAGLSGLMRVKVTTTY